MKQWMYFAVVLHLFLPLKSFCTELEILKKNIFVNGKEAVVLSIAQPDGTLGLYTKKGDLFDVLLKNTTEYPTSIHWHDLILPNEQDGVGFVTQFALYPDQAYHYQFPLVQSGTYWMHSHLGLQEQRLLSAPLIISDPEDQQIADQEVVVFFADFSFKSPQEIFENLRSRCQKKETRYQKPSQDIVDVDYDAFLTNYRTIDNPEIISVEPGKKVRLRIINGASATNFGSF